MKRTFGIALLVAATCLFPAIAANPTTTPVPNPEAVSLVPDEYLGAWQGYARIEDNFTSKFSIRFDFVIDGQGSVNGYIGEAKIVKAKWARRDQGSRLAREIVFTLEGPIIPADELVRKEFTLRLDFGDELRLRLEGEGFSDGERMTADVEKEVRLKKAALVVSQLSLMKLRRDSR